ncbi:alpha-amylase family glycosyl hydrolase [Algoriphagus sp. AK58]|uniref:alpha-amylase family glycosyl hydrolase n=1 Tax=Algoriphagus sp. AK58 TaxID=1406877 RepID=UPI0016509CC9|nr:alpha-amylase family glycosyl hydrolase [Algoriphagus sp. AK58]MBC6366412.1 alpha-amylase [Algoriphagus sp. AK58]
MANPTYPSLYQINTRVYLTELSQGLGRPATLDDIPDSDLVKIAEKGFDWVWFLSVWKTGEKGRKISLNNPEWREEFQKTLPDLKDQDIGGSGFSIAGYQVHPALGGDAALKRLRKRLSKLGLKLMLDFVPNHMGPDHPWVERHLEFFVSGTEEDLQRSPQNYTKVKAGKKEWIVGYGRDPYFEGWPDTLQLDYSNPAVVEAMIAELRKVSTQCDGVRCDMAMLILPEVFEKTWGRRALSFWPEAISEIRKTLPEFCFMAEVYWDLEWTLQQAGFNYTYDKRLYDRLLDACVRDIRGHLRAEMAFQNKLARFMENHDEPRAASMFSDIAHHQAAAVITYLTPGLRFFHQGQLEGKTKRISPHLVRGPKEPVHKVLQKFYDALLKILNLQEVRDGKWMLLECVPAWEGNSSWDAFVAFGWVGPNPGQKWVVVVNYRPYRSQCYLKLPCPEFAGSDWKLQDLMSKASYERNGYDLQSGGLYLDLDAWGYHVFDMKKIKSKSKNSK